MAGRMKKGIETVPDEQNLESELMPSNLRDDEERQQASDTSAQIGKMRTPDLGKTKGRAGLGGFTEKTDNAGAQQAKQSVPRNRQGR